MRKPKRPSIKKPARLFKRRTPLLPRRHVPDDSLGHVAVHEAAHAVGATLLGLKVQSVDLHRRREPGGRFSLGRCDYGTCDKNHVMGNKEAAWPYLIVSMVGAIAEDKVHPCPCPENDSHDQDVDIASDFAALAFVRPGTATITSEERNAPQVEAFFDSAVDAAEKFVDDHWNAIIKVADALWQRKQLTGDEVTAIVESV